MKAVILAAGQGKRMKSKLAKVLHCVLDKPMLTHIIMALNNIEIGKSFVIVGHNKEQIENYLEVNNLNSLFEPITQDPPLGSGHALMQVTPQLIDYKGDLLVLNGDMPLIQPKTIVDLIATHKNNNSDLTILTANVVNPFGFGRIVRDDNNNIKAIVEEKDANFTEKNINEINVGIYCFNWTSIKNGLNNLQPNNVQGEYYLTDLIKWANLNHLKISAYTMTDFKEACGVNSRADLTLANRYLSDINIAKLQDEGVTIIDPASTWIGSNVKIGIDTIIFPNTILFDNIIIGENCIIGPNTSINGTVNIGNNCEIKASFLNNCNIGNDCKVGPFANIRFNTNLESHVKVGNFVEVKASSISDHTNVSHLSYIGDTQIGQNSNVGAGTITANYNHLTKEKFKTIIGSNVAIGSNCVLVAPVKIGDSTLLAAGSVITKEVPNGALAVARQRQANKLDYVKVKSEILES